VLLAALLLAPFARAAPPSGATRREVGGGPRDHVRLGVLQRFKRRYEPDDIGALGLKRVSLDNRNPEREVRCSFAADAAHRYVATGAYTYTDPRAGARAARALGDKLNRDSIRTLGQSFALPRSVRAILERPSYSRPEALARNLVLYDEISRGREFNLYSGEMRVHGFSFFKRLGLLSPRERLVLVIPEVQLEGLQMGETLGSRRRGAGGRQARGRLDLSYARLVRDLLYSGFAATLKDRNVEQIEINAWGVQNPFLRRSYEQLGFQMVGKRELRSKAGSAGTGYDYSIVIKKKGR